ncbi:ABC transporter permease [Phenylobacterium sp. SCN 70-31]|uniref:ABC transporter permease n=1 Tax=Phenylobacterium sp. SCN 70-31 TaxID=1660129 RepID=UPI00086F0E96|nr:ABC transporter permease [Phenylobacterium sp. SCN 70-31]ODT87185.1 MAG: multidrug ABC transporter substrate-binding protein [Phenylobacterium sp. SCN 70-31]
MSFLELIRFALGAIVAHPMRSVLTSLGVVIGVAAVVMMTSIGLGAQQRVTEAISGLGSNLIIVTPNFQRGPVSQGAGGGFSLRDSDAEAIARQVENVTAVAPLVRGQAQLASDGANWNTQIQGVTPDYLLARDLRVASGRMFDEREGRQGRKVLVVGPTVARELWGDADPVGRRVRVRSVPFEVIGVLESKGQAGFGQDQDDVVLAPLSAVRSRITGRRFRGDAVQTIYVKAADEQSLNQVQDDVTNLLREQHKIRPGDDDDFQTQNMASILEASQAAVGAFTVLLAAVAGVSLVVGGVGIMNIMLVAVTERTREIGLRMAVGAKRSHILIQFALESVSLSLVGGLIGLSLGVLGAFAIARLGDWPAAVPPWAGPLALGFSMVVGLVFGAYPSWRAARLDPIEALRRE